MWRINAFIRQNFFFFFLLGGQGEEDSCLPGRLLPRAGLAPDWIFATVLWSRRRQRCRGCFCVGGSWSGPPGTALGCTGSTLGSPAQAALAPGLHPAPLQRSPGPALSVAVLLFGFEALFLYSGRKLEQTTLFKALLLIFLCVFMTAKRRCFLG